jgi:type I restriction enzyme S subunit
MSKAWPTVRLGDAVREEREAAGNFDGGGLPVLGVTNVEGVTHTGIEASEDRSKYLRVRPGRFVYNPYRINVGSIGLSSDAQDGICSPAYVVFAPSEHIDPLFLKFFLKSARGSQLINFHGNRGSVRSALRFDDLCKIEIPLPPLAEQQRAVARIEELAAEIEAARALRQKAEQETNGLTTACLNSILDSHSHTNVWPLRFLPEVAGVARGKFAHRPRNEARFYGGSFPFIQIGDISNSNQYIRKYSQTLNEQGLAISRMFPAGTVVIAITGTTIGVTGILTFDSCFPDSIVGIQAKPDFTTSEFIFFAVEYAKKAALAEATQTTQPNINLGNLERLQLRVPPLPEQDQIVAKLHQLQSEVDLLRREQAQTAAELEALLPTVLDRAFKGELV